MRFEHLVQINDPLMPLLTPLTRLQLWRGLVHRVQHPNEFVPGLQDFEVGEARRDGTRMYFERTLDFGSFQVHDSVVLVELDRSIYRVRAGAGFPASRLTIRIEEPQPEALFLRFLYEWEQKQPDGAVETMATALRNQAYEKSDLDTVQRIRELAESGLLDRTH